MPPFVPIKKQREPGDGEKKCPPCAGTGSMNTHACATCHGAGVVPESWKSGDGPIGSNKTTSQGTPAKGKPAK